MQSQLVLLLLALSMILVSAKTIRSVDGENDTSDEQQPEMFHSNHKFNHPQIYEEMLTRFLKNRANNQEYNPYETIAKRAKAIIKGDPREFMG
ncbi:unnamed protein product [Adineta steineri]|uniref:Uncharacterized protein n=1 Tax=Adineta steineri TaxID=433720 RepID=A0A815DTV6_9BILA|nr:unnamed protein product [Adineta steineri]CAF1406131.1 unnamed protein product [Adineta steineri]CAF3918245.1 unnamed protein product [Adineta steineri]CAF4034212.1 unnamed protein product [Adineta steineri]